MLYYLLYKIIFLSLEAKAVNTYQLPSPAGNRLWSFISKVELSAVIPDTSF